MTTTPIDTKGLARVLDRAARYASPAATKQQTWYLACLITNPAVDDRDRASVTHDYMPAVKGGRGRLLTAREASLISIFSDTVKNGPARRAADAARNAADFAEMRAAIAAQGGAK